MLSRFSRIFSVILSFLLLAPAQSLKSLAERSICQGSGLLYNAEALIQPLRFAGHMPFELSPALFSQTRAPLETRYSPPLIKRTTNVEINIQKIRDGLDPLKPYSGYDIIIIVTAYEADCKVQQEQFDALFAGRAKVVAIQLPISGGGPTIDTLRAYQVAKRRVPNLDRLWAKGKKIAIILNSGEGRRDSPLTQSENNSRGAIRIGGHINLRSKKIPLTLLNSTYAQNALFAQSNLDGQYLDVFYANQIYLPSTNISVSPSQAPLVKFASLIQDPEQLTSDTVQELGIYEIDSKGNVAQNFPKATFKTANEAREWLATIRTKDHQAAYSLGSHRIRRDFFQALSHYYGDLLEDRSLSLQPPDIIVPLLYLSKAYRQIPMHVWEQMKTSQDVLDAVAHYSDKTLLADMNRAQRLQEVLRFYLTYRRTFGEDPGQWFGLFEIGKDIFWWRYRWPLSILNNQLLMLSDLTGEKVQLGTNGRRLELPAITQKDLQESQLLRELRGIAHPLANSQFGEVSISETGVRSDTAEIVSFEQLKTGIMIGGVFLQGSIVLNSVLPAGSRVVHSFVEDRQGEVDVTNSFIERSSGDRLVARESLVYNVVNQNPLEAAGTTVADVFRPGIPEYSSRGLLAGQTRMWVDFRNEPSAYDDMILSRNSYSFSQLREMETDPLLDEKIRKRIKGELILRKAAPPGALIPSIRKTVLIVGAEGFLGKKLYKTFSKSFTRVIGTSYSKSTVSAYHLDVTNEAEVKACIERFQPDIIVYAAGEANPDKVNSDPDRAWKVNAGALNIFGRYFKGHFIYISSDYVFDGKHPPYSPSAKPSPLNEYGRTKVVGEIETLGGFPKGSVIRTGLLYGYNDSNDRSTFVSEIVHQLDSKEVIRADNSQIRHPALIDEVASLALTVAHQENTGVFHLDGMESFTKYDLARVIADVYYHMFPQSISDEPFRVLLDKIIPISVSAAIDRPHDSKLESLIAAIPFASGIRRVIRRLSSRLKGGSFSRTIKIMRDDAWIVRKEAYDRGREKLINEIEWLKELPRSMQAHFPTVLSSMSDLFEAAYEMPFYTMPTLTELIIEDEWTAEQIVRRLQIILDFYIRDVASKKREPTQFNYATHFLIQKIIDRTAETVNLAPGVFADLVSANALTINGTQYRNALPILEEIKQNPTLLQRLQPPFLSLFHGDFHLDNMLVDKEDELAFILLDPRGDRVGDPIYDLAKLLHSIVGKYDILNYDLHRTLVAHTRGGIGITLSYPTDRISWKVYVTLEKYLQELVQNSFMRDAGISEDPHWLERLAFSHAALFASDMPFHLKGDGKEERAVAIYATGVILLNEFMDLAEGKIKTYHRLQIPLSTSA